MQSVLNDAAGDADAAGYAACEEQQGEREHHDSSSWTLLPVDNVAATLEHSSSSHLTVILKHALEMARHRQQQQLNQQLNQQSQSHCHHGGRIVFLGMDCPEVPLQELVALTRVPTTAALLCPAADGGYGLLAVPTTTPNTIFDGVLWSHPWTAVSQLKALNDAGLQNVVLGPMMHDVDTPADVDALRNRLLPLQRRLNTAHDGNPTVLNTAEIGTSILTRPSAIAAAAVLVDATFPVSCRYTRKTLQDLLGKR